ncbi:hypothetical protein CYY_007924 [Polysphondylium violaceum]|uniref:Glutaredoxin domain-containing protein n=1 Tax=Polysphondylium violaceum TaxID=133409 RepID=A0A8J4PQ17_9MYCE|nr:hypothetical protein CYY_007924 [Polysphondylium violaceum]
MSTRRILTNLTENGAQAVNAFHPEIVNEVVQNIESNKVLVVGMAYNPHCSGVCKALTAAGVEFKYLEYGSYFSMWNQRLAIKMFTGWPTFPQVFVNGALLGGEADTVKELNSGSLFDGLKKK